MANEWDLEVSCKQTKNLSFVALISTINDYSRHPLFETLRYWSSHATTVSYCYNMHFVGILRNYLIYHKAANHAASVKGGEILCEELPHLCNKEDNSCHYQFKHGQQGKDEKLLQLVYNKQPNSRAFDSSKNTFVPWVGSLTTELSPLNPAWWYSSILSGLHFRFWSILPILMHWQGPTHTTECSNCKPNLQIINLINLIISDCRYFNELYIFHGIKHSPWYLLKNKNT